MEDHRLEVGQILARTRRSVWLVKGRMVARRVARGCMWCRRRKKEPVQQQIGRLPPQVAEIAPPFSHLALDLFGPLLVKGLGGHARKCFKAWGVLFVCLGCKAVAIWLSPSYAAKDFMDCLQKQVAIYGVPVSIHSDKGSQLTAAASDLREWEDFSRQAEELGITWTFSPTACPWRNGQAERAIGLAKRSLEHVVNHFETLTFVEMEAALLKTAALLNRRPLSARIYSEDEFHPISPSDLLLGRISGYQGWASEETLGEGTDLGPRLEKVNRLTQLWWQRWTEAALELLTPLKKWTRAFRNLEVGDIVMLHGGKAFGKGEYRLGRVQALNTDSDGLVRTVVVGLCSRRRRGREAEAANRVPLELVPVAVQRLSVLLPVEEQQELQLQANEAVQQ